MYPPGAWWLGLVGMSMLVVTMPLQPSVAWSEPAPVVLAATDTTDDLLLATGFQPRLEDLSSIVEAEISTLAGAGFFAPGEIERVSSELRLVREDTLYRQLHQSLSASFNAAEWQQLRRWSETPGLKALLAGEVRLRTADGKSERNAYLEGLKGKTPHADRLILMEALSDARSRVLLESLTRVELRKNLLSAVARAKTGKPLAETALRSELLAYDKSLRASLMIQRRDDYLFLFRHTPTEAIDSLLKLHDDPLYVRFMQTATRTLREGIAASRR